MRPHISEYLDVALTGVCQCRPALTGKTMLAFWTLPALRPFGGNGSVRLTMDRIVDPEAFADTCGDPKRRKPSRIVATLYLLQIVPGLEHRNSQELAAKCFEVTVVLFR